LTPIYHDHSIYNIKYVIAIHLAAYLSFTQDFPFLAIKLEFFDSQEVSSFLPKMLTTYHAFFDEAPTQVDLQSFFANYVLRLSF
jgi:hypothetical protein